VTVVRTASPYTKQHIMMSFMMLSIKPMAAAAPTNLEPKYYRSRRGTGPISVWSTTDLDAELDRSRQ